MAREIVGFWTESYLRDKLEQLRAAGLGQLIVCIDERRGCGGPWASPAAPRCCRFAPGSMPSGCSSGSIGDRRVRSPDGRWARERAHTVVTPDPGDLRALAPGLRLVEV